MKRTKYGAVCLMMLLCLGGCGKTDGNDNGGQSGNTSQIPNPVVEYNSPDFTDNAGFKVAQYPDVEPYRFALIDNYLGEIYFSIDNTELLFRVAAESGGGISGVYDAFDENYTVSVGEVNVEIGFTADKAMLSKWSKDGYVFSLYGDKGDLTKSSFEALTESFVTQVVMEPEKAN